MKTRKELLVELVAGFGSWTPNEGSAWYAGKLLAEIEKACPETEFRPPVVMQTENVRIYMQKDVDALVAAERERCAKIAEEMFVNRRHGDEIAAAIRGAK